MNKLLKILSSAFVTLFLFLALVKIASASEGTFELESTTRDNFRCFAAALLLENRNYKLIVTCRNLIYPPETELFSYTLWANSISDGKQIKFGSLGIGKATFSTKKAFDQLYVTIEKDKRVGKPTGTVVMRGNLQRIEFLEQTKTPTPKEEPSDEVTGEEEQAEEEEKPLSTRDKLLTGLRRAGLIAFFALVALIGLIFVVSRSRG